MSRNKVLVHYSGGLDSNLSAARLALKNYEVYLVTYDNGLTIHPEVASLPAKLLKKRFPNQIISHDIIPIYGLVKRVALNNIEEDFKNHKRNLICMACKLAMTTESVIYAKSHNIGLITDGYNKRQGEWPEQMPEAIEEVKKFLQSYGIEYMNNVYEKVTKDSVKQELLDLGLIPKSIEGACMIGGTFSLPTPNEVVDYIRQKRPILDEYLKDRLKDLYGV